MLHIVLVLPTNGLSGQVGSGLLPRPWMRLRWMLGTFDCFFFFLVHAGWDEGVAKVSVCLYFRIFM